MYLNTEWRKKRQFYSNIVDGRQTKLFTRKRKVRVSADHKKVKKTNTGTQSPVWLKKQERKRKYNIKEATKSLHETGQRQKQNSM
jgi:hypothetical protein